MTLDLMVSLLTSSWAISVAPGWSLFGPRALATNRLQPPPQFPSVGLQPEDQTYIIGAVNNCLLWEPIGRAHIILPCKLFFFHNFSYLFSLASVICLYSASPLGQVFFVVGSML
jgi:hypothetical protein